MSGTFLRGGSRVTGLTRPTIRPILRYGERGLHERAAGVTTFDEALQRLIDDMKALRSPARFGG